MQTRTLKIPFILLATFALIVGLMWSMRATAQVKKTYWTPESGTSFGAPKSTRITDTVCSALDFVVVDLPAKAGTERFRVLAVPSFCVKVGSGFFIYGEYSDIRQWGPEISGTVFFTAKSTENTIDDWTTPAVGTEVLVPDIKMMEFVVNGVTISASAGNTQLSARVASTNASADRRTSTLSPSGANTTYTGLGSDLILLDRDLQVAPGTAVFDTNNRLIGMLLGWDSGKSLVIPINQLIYQGAAAGLPINLKG